MAISPIVYRPMFLENVRFVVSRRADMDAEPTTTRTTGYDRDLHMYIEPPCEQDLNTMRFIKWLVDTSRLEGDTKGERN
jgi:hypothetical protein